MVIKLAEVLTEDKLYLFLAGKIRLYAEEKNNQPTHLEKFN